MLILTIVQFFQDRGLARLTAATRPESCLSLGLLKLAANLLPPGLPSACPTTSALAQALFISHPDPCAIFQTDSTDPLPLVSLPSNPSSNHSQSDVIVSPPPLLFKPPTSQEANPNSFAWHHRALPASLADLISLWPSPSALFQSQLE